MGVFSNRVPVQHLQPGDHIYTWRTAYTYAHHGIYVGNQRVVHFTRGAGQEVGTGTVIDRFIFSSSPANAGVPCEKCGNQIRKDGVIVSCLDCFLGGDSLYLFEYAVSTTFFLAKARGGTCTLASSDPPADVLHRANYLLRNGFGTYNLFKNCEDFAIYCKTGLLVVTNFGVGRSGQMGSVLAAVSAITSSPLRYLTTGFGGLTVVAGGLYCLNRYMSDIGIRRDVKKIVVETLVSVLEEEQVARRAAEDVVGMGEQQCSAEPRLSPQAA